MNLPDNRMEKNVVTRITVAPEEPSDFQTQTYKTMTCPNCGSEQIRTTSTDPITEQTTKRRHFCKRCGAKFNSLGTVPLIDRPDWKNVRPGKTATS